MAIRIAVPVVSGRTGKVKMHRRRLLRARYPVVKKRTKVRKVGPR